MKKDGSGGDLLLRWIVHEIDSLLNVALQALGASRKELLLLVCDATEGVGGLLSAVGLFVRVSARINALDRGGKSMLLTPSSMGTEKKSHPTASAISFPPGTPGR